MTEEEKKQVLADFQREFDIFNLTSEILDRLEYPAEKNQIYEAEVVKFERKRSGMGKPIACVKMKTADKKVLEMVLNDEWPSDQTKEFIGKLGAGSAEQAIGKKARVFYSSGYPAIVVVGTCFA